MDDASTGSIAGVDCLCHYPYIYLPLAMVAEMVDAFVWSHNGIQYGTTG